MSKLARFCVVLCLAVGALEAQSLGNAGTIEGTVTDPSGAAIPKAEVELQNPISGYTQTVTSNASGEFRLLNIPPNPYHLKATATGFSAFNQDIAIRNSLPVQVNAKLTLGKEATTVTVEAAGADLVEVDPSAHVDADRNQIAKLPTFDPGGG
jgi:hypothetical protein